MTECARCGDCCTNLPLNTPERADIYGRKILASADRRVSGKMRKMAAWMGNLIPVGAPWRAADGSMRWRYRCPLFDEATRTCTDHANRPSVCSRYPFYGREPQSEDRDVLSPRCSFLADVPGIKMLPIVEVRHAAA